MKIFLGFLDLLERISERLSRWVQKQRVISEVANLMGNLEEVDGKTLRRLRERAGLNEGSAALLLKISRTCLWQIETNRTISGPGVELTERMVNLYKDYILKRI